MQAAEMLRDMAVREAEAGAVEAAAVLLNAALYLANPLNYARLTIDVEHQDRYPATLDHWMRDVVRGGPVPTIRVRWTAEEMAVV